MDNSTSSDNQLILNEVIKSTLTSSTKWTRFLAVIGYIFATLFTLVVLIGIVNMSYYSQISYRGHINYSYYDRYSLGYSLGYSLLLLIACGVNFAIANYLMSYSNNMRNAIYYNNINYLEKAFRSLNNHFKIIGIIVIVYLSIITLVILFGVISIMQYRGYR